MYHLFRVWLNTPWHFIQDVDCLVHPTPLVCRPGKFLFQSGPEAESTISNSKLWQIDQATFLQVAKNRFPRFLAFDDLPECVISIIENPKDPGPDPVRIEEYQYSGEAVYYVERDCCDAFNEVYDKNCEHICSPDGGKSGDGDGSCSDFFDTATGGEVLWELKD